jgi:hypothetical protein
VSVSNCFPWTLEALQLEFGGSVRLKCAAKGNSRTAFQWDIYGKSAISCCEAVVPYLIEKKPQALLLLEYPRWPVRSAKRTAILLELRRLKRTDYV